MTLTQVADEIDQPVQDHQTDDHDDGDDVDLLDDVGGRCAQTLAADAVDRGRGHLLGDVRVALAAGASAGWPG